MTTRLDHSIEVTSTKDGTKHFATCYEVGCGWASPIYPTREQAEDARQQHLDGIEW